MLTFKTPYIKTSDKYLQYRTRVEFTLRLSANKKYLTFMLSYDKERREVGKRKWNEDSWGKSINHIIELLSKGHSNLVSMAELFNLLQGCDQLGIETIYPIANGWYHHTRKDGLTFCQYNSLPEKELSRESEAIEYLISCMPMLKKRAEKAINFLCEKNNVAIESLELGKYESPFVKKYVG